MKLRARNERYPKDYLELNDKFLLDLRPIYKNVDEQVEKSVQRIIEIQKLSKLGYFRLEGVISQQDCVEETAASNIGSMEHFESRVKNKLNDQTEEKTRQAAERQRVLEIYNLFNLVDAKFDRDTLIQRCCTPIKDCHPEDYSSPMAKNHNSG